VTLQLLWVEYREAHPDGYGYSQFANLYRQWRGRVDVTMRESHRAGEKLFVDFPGNTVPIYDPRTGEVALRAELFVAVMGASNYLYAEAFPSQELLYWVTAHVHCFEHLGGCPAIVVCDNLRSAVSRPHRYEPDVNATFAEMAAHYGVAVIPARAYKPRDKAKAESGVLLAERWIIVRLRDRKFFSPGEANAAIRACVAEINARPFQKLDGTRRSLFEQLDRPALRPLPATRYEFATWRRARVNIDYHVEADKHYYSVPYQLARQQADVRLSAATVEVFHGSRRVASHPRSFVRHGHTTDPAHMPDAHRRHAVDPAADHRLGRQDRPGHRRPGRQDPGVAAAPGAGLPGRARDHPPGRPLRRRAGRGRLRPGAAPALVLLPQRRVDPARRPGPPAAARERPAPAPHPAHANVRGPGYYH
jgi:transposase